MNESMTSSQRQTFDFKGFRNTFKKEGEEPIEAASPTTNLKGKKMQLR